MRGLVIMRGLPGSGKSTLAKKLAEGENSVVYAADDFFEDGVIDLSRVHLAHMWCHSKVEEALSQGIDLIIVANTNTRRKDIVPYMELASKYGVEAVILEVECSVETSVARNIHGCPEGTVREMANFMRTSPLDPDWKLVKVTHQG